MTPPEEAVKWIGAIFAALVCGFVWGSLLTRIAFDRNREGKR